MSKCCFLVSCALSGLIILLLITYLKKQHKCSHLDCGGTLSALVPVGCVAEITVCHGIAKWDTCSLGLRGESSVNILKVIRFVPFI